MLDVVPHDPIHIPTRIRLEMRVVITAESEVELNVAKNVTFHRPALLEEIEIEIVLMLLIEAEAEAGHG